jgi:hypothetical protein
MHQPRLLTCNYGRNTSTGSHATITVRLQRDGAIDNRGRFSKTRTTFGWLRIIDTRSKP